MKRVAPSHKEWTPSAGQADAVDFLVSTPAGALFADPGAGKTSITLAAFGVAQAERAHYGQDTQMLVIAPLRVCQLVWRQEAQKWTQFRHLRIGLLHGPHKDKVLKERDQYDILLVNYEGLDWLCDKFAHRQLPFDIICADELTKLKAHDGKRAKKLRKQTERTPIKWGLTGTPIPNGYMDLFGQFLWLDGGKALGKYITHYRDMYFKVGFTGFDYTLQTGAAERIEKRIEPSVLRLSYEAMPLHDIPIEIEMPADVRALYREMKNEMILELPGGVITAANAAVVQQKLEQMANGAVYVKPGEPEWAHIHDLKLDALEDLIESLNGQQLLIAYQFQHDLERIQARFPLVQTMTGGEAYVKRVQDDWNTQKIQLMAVHPASAGHGLNLQLGNANKICWFSATFNLEHWDQLIRRLRRQGSTAAEITNYILAVKGTVDELKLEVLGDKDTTQARLLQGLADHLEDGNANHTGPGRRRAEDSDAGEPTRGRDQQGRVLGKEGPEPSTPDGAKPSAGVAERGAGLRGDDVPDAVHERSAAGQAAGSARLARTQEGGGGRSLPSDPRGSVAVVGHPTQDTEHTQGERPMTMGFKRLPVTAADAAGAATAPQQAATPTPKGWNRAPAAAAAAPAAEAQKEAIRARVTPAARAAAPEPAEDAPAPTARSFFSRGVQAALAPAAEPLVSEDANTETVGIPETAQPEPATAPVARTRKPRAVAQADQIADAVADVKGVESVQYAGLGNASNGVHLSFNGLPPHAIKAALLAIAQNL